MRSLLGFALLLAACRAPGVDQSRPDGVAASRPAPPSPKPSVDEATWRSWAAPCNADDECTAVPRGCCACGANSYRPVLKRNEAEASKSVVMGDCNCPQQHCNRIVLHCRAESCAVEEN